MTPDFHPKVTSAIDPLMSSEVQNFGNQDIVKNFSNLLVQKCHKLYADCSCSYTISSRGEVLINFWDQEDLFTEMNVMRSVTS